MKTVGWVVALGVVIVMAAAVFSSCDQGIVPEALQGTWVTDEPRYDACFIYLTEDSIEIGTQEGISDAGVVIAVIIDKDQKYPRYEIAYLDSFGEDSLLSLSYDHDPTEVDTLWIGSQRDVLWWRESDYDS